MNRRAFILGLAATALPAALPGSAMAGFLDSIMDPASKESKLLSGAVSVLSSTQQMDYKNERLIGERLAVEGLRRYGMPVQNKGLQHYVNLVGMAVAVNSPRPNIPYRFVVVDSEVQNAFACPGGIIFVTQALVGTMTTEAQLAGILAHEVGHVSLRHALKSIQRAQFFSGVGKITAATMKGDKGAQFENMINDLQNVLFDKGLDQNMEYEADASAMQTAYRTGYTPAGITETLQALQKLEAKSTKKGSWFSTHPPLPSRIAKNQAAMRQYPDAATLAVLPDRFAAQTK
ncbi:Peptidase family M48 [Humidesulfovibrio mexicanus]|uniref:Peptidase family M48 n=1 Tax=Humidesulfovibrio mexicanus TaxID=147047 RepID=A0A238ZD57_9BACT|nr:M48 family metalloprotease [Humidesulfovibrio mexicanus]SNR81012.1 Peptidase family M48 [Humidesulfovibrio mexicanus]